MLINKLEPLFFGRTFRARIVYSVEEEIIKEQKSIPYPMSNPQQASSSKLLVSFPNLTLVIKIELYHWDNTP